MAFEALKQLQEKCGVAPDGAFGPNTARAIVTHYELSPERGAHLLGQTVHESGSFKYTSENLNYSVDACLKVFGKYFKTEEKLNIFELKKYSFRERLKLSEKYCKLSKFITDQKINLIFATVAMMDKPRKWNRRNIKNYIEIYIKSDVKKIIKEKKKKIYFNKKNTNLVGINVKAEFPKNSDIVINNKFNIPISKISDNLFNKINKLIYY